MKSSLLPLAAALFATTSAFAGTVIPTAPFKSIELHGGGHVILHRGASQQVVLNAGSTQYTSFHIEDGNTLVIDACNNSCPNGEYDLAIDIATPDIGGVAIEGGGEITGSADLAASNLHAAVNGGGRIDMRAVHAQTADAAVSGGGHIQIYAERKLNAAVSGGGRIEYWGTPQLASAISGGGDIRKGS
ncbi:MAG TPA: DUF2807 domain-containing protein [Rhizomicrobium sp.]